MYGVHEDLFGEGAGYWYPYHSGSVSWVDAPSDTVMVAEKGQSNAITSWLEFVTWEGWWTDTVGSPAGSVRGKNLDVAPANQRIAGLPADCDNKATASTSPGDWGSCGAMPRYRHTGTTNFLFCDGHVKSMNRGGVSWYKNIYVAKAYAKDASLGYFGGSLF